MPRLKGASFEPAIIERYRRKESSVEETLYRDVPGWRFCAPCGGHHGGSVGQQSLARHHQRAEQESLRPHRGLAVPPLQGGRYPYVYVDGICLRRNWGGECENIAILEWRLP